MSSINLQEIDNFLSEEECLQIIKMIDSNNSRSLVAAGGKNPGEANDYRTSSTSNLPTDNLLIRGLQQKIAGRVNLPIEKGESLQGQVYETGQYFREHTDFFEGEAYNQHCLSSGNRTKTLMIYLNDVPEGGQTTFPKLNKVIEPKIGKALLWDNMDKNGNLLYDALHEGTPPTQGKKYIVTSWWRENKWDNVKDFEQAPKPTEVENVVEDNKVIQLHQDTPPKVEVIDVNVEDIPQPETNDNGIVKPIGDFLNKLNLSPRVEKTFTTDPTTFPKFHEVGFEKVRVPEVLMGLINDSYNILKVNGGLTEDWDGLTDVIGGEDMPEMFSFDFIPNIRNFIHESLKPMHEAWSGQELEPTMMYGIRSYVNGSNLITHTDRIDTHHISCIIIVDKDLQGGKDWPLHIKDHNGNWNEVYGEPGDMIIYESIACEHGRPTTFEGNYYRNFYAHYKLTEYTQV